MTVTVKELIHLLEQQDPEARVIVNNDFVNPYWFNVTGVIAEADPLATKTSGDSLDVVVIEYEG